MKNLIKCLIGVALVASCVSASAVTYTYINSTGTNGVFLITTNRASVYSVEITGPQAGKVDLFDMDSVAPPFNGTNYTNATYWYRYSFATNLVTTNVGYNGYINYSTNAGYYTVYITNTASTNNPLPVMGSFVTAGSTYAVYPFDGLFVRGICAKMDTNITIVINARSGQ